MKMSREQAKEQIKHGLSRLNDALAEGRSEELEHYLKTMSRFHRYSFNNIMLILMQNPEALHVAGFNAWKQLGRTVNKGEKGLAIVAPCRYKSKDDDESGEETSSVRGFRVVYVFDISQTEGDELPELLGVSGDPGQALEKLKAYIEELGIELVYQPSMGPGCFGSSQGGTINVREGLDAALEFSVLAHEVAHEDLHHGERRSETSKTVRETEAEAVASVVCSVFGLDSSQTSADYINMYRGSVETLGESLQFIQKTAETIIEGINGVDIDAVEVAPKTEAAKAESPCNHTIECFGDSRALQGSWTTEETETGTHVICRHCQKFYGYVSKDESAEETEPLRIGRSDYEERQAERIERYHELAEKRGREANETHQGARTMAGAIPFGQPILVGHHSEKRDRNYRERIHNKFGKAFELNDKAKYWENRAAAAESGNAISSDDPQAIEKLKAKLEDIEQSQAAMKAINKAWRAAGKPGPEDASGWGKIAEHPEVHTEPEQVEKLRIAYAQLLQWQGNSAPFPSYSLSNNNAEMRRIRERIKVLEASAKAEHIEKNCGVCRYVENPELNRVQLFFDGKPSAEIRAILKKNGFRFSRRDGNAWQRHLNSQGKLAVQWALAEIEKLSKDCSV